MPLQYVDSFDDYNTSQILTKWTAMQDNGGNFINATTGRNGTQAYQCGNNGNHLIKQIGQSNNLIVGFAYEVASTLPRNPITLAGWAFEGSGACFLQMNRDGTLSITVSGTSLLGTNSHRQSDQALFSGVYYYIEWKMVLNTSGAADCLVRVNGSPFFTLQSGQQTAPNPLLVVDQLILGDVLGVAGQTTYYDDLYLMAALNSTDSFLGDIGIYVLYPNGVGSNTQWSLQGAASNWQATKEHPPDDNTSYVYTGASGTKDTYAMDDVSSSTTAIGQVQVNVYCEADDVGTRTLAPVVRSGGVDYPGLAQTVQQSYQIISAVWIQDPHALANWGTTTVNAMECGQQLAG